MNDLNILSTFAASLFALLNPLGMLPVFVGYTQGLSPGVQRWLALLVAVTVLALMLLFLISGTAILDFFGIGIDAFRMAGGILLLLIGIRIVTGDGGAMGKQPVAEQGQGDFLEARTVYRQIVIPFALPLLVGPGVIANLILYASEARRLHDPRLSLGLIAVTGGVALLTFVILLSGRMLKRALGDIGLGILTRILGLLVAAIGMQFLVTGTSDIVVNTIAPEIMKLR